MSPPKDDDACEATYYTSDSPCRRCNGTLRYRTPVSVKGKCSNCVKDDEDEDERRGRNWMLASGMMNVAGKAQRK